MKVSREQCRFRDMQVVVEHKPDLAVGHVDPIGFTLRCLSKDRKTCSRRCKFMVLGGEDPFTPAADSPADQS